MGVTDSYVSCTWMDRSNCENDNCDISRTLACRWDPKEYKFALIGQMPLVFLTILSLIMTHMITGKIWPYFSWWFWFLIIWPLGLETLVLCRHCPYYTDSGKTLTCWALRFMPKWWKPSPKPMNRLEKFVFQYLVWDLSQIWGLPFAAYTSIYIVMNYQKFGAALLAAMIGIFICLAISIYQFFHIMKVHNCSRCVAFSCPKNTVPKKYVDKYLERNPVMKEAWVRDGYEMDEV